MTNRDLIVKNRALDLLDILYQEKGEISIKTLLSKYSTTFKKRHYIYGTVSNLRHFIKIPIKIKDGNYICHITDYNELELYKKQVTLTEFKYKKSKKKVHKNNQNLNPNNKEKAPKESKAAVSKDLCIDFNTSKPIRRPLPSDIIISKESIKQLLKLVHLLPLEFQEEYKMMIMKALVYLNSAQVLFDVHVTIEGFIYEK